MHHRVHCITIYNNQDMEQSECPLTEEWIKKMWYIYIMEYYSAINSVQFSPVPQSCLTLCDPMDCSRPGFPVHYQLLELAHTHAHP